jgi:anaerobic ribonucleoside-triphosphate reductase
MSTSNPNYDLRPCPCCGSKVVTTPGEYEICEVCGWEDDPVQSADPDYAGGANKLSLNQARKEWLAKKPKP